MIGPTGVALASDGTLYLADTLDNRITAVPHAMTRTTPVGDAGITVSQGGHLKQPLGLALAPNGDIITTNAGDGNMVETTPAGKQVAVVTADKRNRRRIAVRTRHRAGQHASTTSTTATTRCESCTSGLRQRLGPCSTARGGSARRALVISRQVPVRVTTCRVRASQLMARHNPQADTRSDPREPGLRRRLDNHTSKGNCMSASQVDNGIDRRQFLGRAGATGAGILVGSGALGALAPSFAAAKKSGVKKSDLEILGAAQIAEALAVTTYTNIINTSPFFAHIPADDQGYLKAARQEEMSHYLLEESVTGKPSPFTSFYYPEKMFSDPKTTLNILVTLEDAFIAAYLVGVRDFSNSNLRVTAARIMGIESDHRTLARVVGGDVAASDGGPISSITGVQGKSESIEPPNNNGYERTLEWKNIGKAVEALLPFAEKKAAKKAGFDTTKPYKFEPFTPALPEPLGEFHSFLG